MPGEVEMAEPKLTELAVEGVGSRSVSYDGAIGRFTVSVLRDSLITAVSDGNKSVQAIADAVAEELHEGRARDGGSHGASNLYLPERPADGEHPHPRRSSTGPTRAGSRSVSSTRTGCRSPSAAPGSPAGWSTW